ncbi:asialoglycoprotein receptor-like 1 isoform X2 [Anabas testudineus]|uniref:C-type lectin domain-containing protein n=1 Tax=Anabas testudineus TaxID=64144 RepID=A0A7N6BFK8_ANATE|nr:asialoglycoprotein receptor-like 1 isoform X2 [Anabas testudineus]
MWSLSVMEPQYHHFGSSDNISHEERKIMKQPTMKRLVEFVLYSVLVLLLLILLMVTGIRFSQLNKDITDIKLRLEQVSSGDKTPSSNPEAVTAKEVYFQKLVPVRGACRDGWVSFQRSCYLLSTIALTWSKAEEQCRTHGGHLVVLNNVEELDYLSKIVELRYNYWIGLVEREHEGHWSWVDGTDFNSTPVFWDKGQPDDWDYRENGEDCGQIHASARRKRKMWNDADCNLVYQYICETRL